MSDKLNSIESSNLQPSPSYGASHDPSNRLNRRSTSNASSDRDDHASLKASVLLTSSSGSLEARLVRDDGHDACVANDRVTLFSKLQLEREIFM